jgi:hypothetical protein
MPASCNQMFYGRDKFACGPKPRLITSPLVPAPDGVGWEASPRADALFGWRGRQGAEVSTSSSAHRWRSSRSQAVGVAVVSGSSGGHQSGPNHPGVRSSILLGHLAGADRPFATACGFVFGCRESLYLRSRAVWPHANAAATRSSFDPEGPSNCPPAADPCGSVGPAKTDAAAVCALSLLKAVMAADNAFPSSVSTSPTRSYDAAQKEGLAPSCAVRQIHRDEQDVGSEEAPGRWRKHRPGALTREL